MEFLRLLTPMTTIVDQVTDWDAPSPCQGWSAAAVVEHIVDSQRDFFAQRGVDLDDNSATGPAQLWATHVAQLHSHVTDELQAMTYDGWFGPTTVRATLESFMAFDLIVHRWDLATAAGLPNEISAAELAEAQAFADTMGDNLYMPGVCQAALPIGPDASAEERLLARLGRRL